MLEVVASLLVQTSILSATVRGTVSVTGDESALVIVEPAPLAARWASTGPVPVRNGAFELKLTGPGAWRLWIRSPGMAEARIPVWLTKDDEVVELRVTLGPDRVLPMRGAPLLRGEWTDFRRAEPMTQLGDGKWVLRGTVPASKGAPTVRYYIERDTAAGPDRRPNPGEPRRETMEHRFVSIADVSEGRFEIRFDPASVPTRDAPPAEAVVAFRRRPDLQSAWQVEALTQRREEGVRYVREVLQLPHNVPSPQLQASYEDLQRKLWRQVAAGPRLAREVAAAHVLRATREPKKRASLLKLLGATAPGWAAAPPLWDDGGMLGVVLPPDEEEAYVRFIEKVASEHSDPALRAVTRMGLASRAKERGDAEAEARHVAELRRAYSDRAFVQNWFRRRDARPYSLAQGMAFPATDAKTLAGAAIGAEYFSRAPLTVAVFSSPSCGSCRLMLPDLRRVRSAYPGEALRVITFHAGKTPEYVRHELSAEPQPWDHVVLGEDEHPLERACDVRFFPTVLLVDGTGKVIDRSDDLWVRIEEAVRAHVRGAPAN